MEAEESVFGVLDAIVQFGGQRVLSTEDLVLGNGGAASIQIFSSCGSVFSSFDKVLTVNSLFQLFWINLVNFVCLESSSKEVLHLVSLLTISFVNLTFVKFGLNEGLVEVLRLIYSNGSCLFTIILFFVLRE